MSEEELNVDGKLDIILEKLWTLEKKMEFLRERLDLLTENFIEPIELYDFDET